MKTVKRMIIYPKDIQRMSGRTERHARNVLNKVRSQLGKEKHHLVTVKEFCSFMKLSEDEVMQFIQ